MRGSAKLHTISTVHQGGGGEYEVGGEKIAKTGSTLRDLFTRLEKDKHGNGKRHPLVCVCVCVRVCVSCKDTSPYKGVDAVP